jgi:hypothetical protein
MRVASRDCVISLLVLDTIPIVGCETAASRQAAQDRNNIEAAEELHSLCGLPVDHRKVEVEKLQKNTASQSYAR